MRDHAEWDDYPGSSSEEGPPPGHPNRRAPGEMGVSASSNGRALTMAPIGAYAVALPIREVEKGGTLAAGFRQMWVEGSAEGGEFLLTVGAGLGSRWGIFTYRGREFAFDVEDLVKRLLELADPPSKTATIREASDGR